MAAKLICQVKGCEMGASCPVSKNFEFAANQQPYLAEKFTKKSD